LEIKRHAIGDNHHQVTTHAGNQEKTADNEQEDGPPDVKTGFIRCARSLIAVSPRPKDHPENKVPDQERPEQKHLQFGYGPGGLLHNSSRVKNGFSVSGDAGHAGIQPFLRELDKAEYAPRRLAN
jgi:hypothetical protein